MQSITGTEVIVDQVEGQVVYGLLYAVTPYNGVKNQCVLKSAREEINDKTSGTSFETGSTVIFDVDTSLCSLRTAPGNHIDVTRKNAGGGVDAQFQTDSSIKAHGDMSSLHGRRLEAVDNSWLTPETSTELTPSNASASAWDQFEVNRTKFGVTSTFDENLYTTRLNLASATPEQLAFAERKAREINNSLSSNVHMQEERGQVAETDMDEEDLYSGVARQTGETSSTPHPAAGVWPRGKLPAAKPAKQPVASTGGRGGSRLASPSLALSEPSGSETTALTPSTPATPSDPPGLSVILNPTQRSSHSPAPVLAPPAAADVADTSATASLPVAAEEAATEGTPAESGGKEEPPSAGSKLNPKAKEFKFNPNAKEFTIPGANPKPVLVPNPQQQLQLQQQQQFQQFPFHPYQQQQLQQPQRFPIDPSLSFQHVMDSNGQVMPWPIQNSFQTYPEFFIQQQQHMVMQQQLMPQQVMPQQLMQQQQFDMYPQPVMGNMNLVIMNNPEFMQPMMQFQPQGQPLFQQPGDMMYAVNPAAPMGVMQGGNGGAGINNGHMNNMQKAATDGNRFNNGDNMNRGNNARRSNNNNMSGGRGGQRMNGNPNLNRSPSGETSNPNNIHNPASSNSNSSNTSKS